MVRLHHLAFRTRDLEGLCSFYEEIFGWWPAQSQTGYSVWYRLGEVVLMLECADDAEPPIPARSAELVAFRVSVEEQREIRERLQMRRIPIEEATEFTLYFRDPDGRRVGVSIYDFEV